MSDLDDKGAGVWDEQKIPRQGDWVQCWGQVRLASDQPGVHPEDVLVEFFSHSEQWAGHVRADRVVPSLYPPEFAEQCTSMRMRKSGAMWRCVLSHDHNGDHEDKKGRKFSNVAVVGYIEEA